MEIKKVTRLAMLLALSVVLGLLESMFPFFNGAIPGLKLGLANIVVLFVLYEYYSKEAILLSILRVFIMGLLVTGVFSITFWFSLGGALLSETIMHLAKKFTKLSIVGVSIVGSISHSIGQILIAILLLKQTAMIYYLPLLLIFSIPTGVIIGLFSRQLVKYFKKD